MKKLFFIVSLFSFISYGQAIKEVVADKITNVKIDTTTDVSKNTFIVTSDTTIVIKGSFKLFKKNAHASYYAGKFNGRKTASGKIYNMHKYTCAHKKLPFGTKLKITNERNHKFVIVEVTDRGPFVKTREVDLSQRAFIDLTGGTSSGTVIVTIEILQK